MARKFMLGFVVLIVIAAAGRIFSANPVPAIALEQVVAVGEVLNQAQPTAKAAGKVEMVADADGDMDDQKVADGDSDDEATEVEVSANP